MGKDLQLPIMAYFYYAYTITEIHLIVKWYKMLHFVNRIIYIAKIVDTVFDTLALSENWSNK